MSDVKLNTVILSHMNDLQYDIYDNPVRAEIRSKFVRSLLFHNEDTNIWVEKEYLDFMYKQAATFKSDYDCSYSEWVTIQECELVK
jgi:hypothetical protein